MWRRFKWIFLLQLLLGVAVEADRRDRTTTWGAPVPVPTYPPDTWQSSDPSSYTPSAPAPAPAPYYPGPAPAPAPYYPAPAPAPAPAPEDPNATGYYYYYYPVKDDSHKGIFGKDKHKDISFEGKTWMGLLIPLAVIAVGIPIMALIFNGLGLVTGRSMNIMAVDELKKDVGEMLSVYTRVLESEECVKRMVCELGSYATRMPAKSYIFSMLDSIVPSTMKNNMAVFTKSALYGREEVQCETFRCSPLDGK